MVYKLHLFKAVIKKREQVILKGQFIIIMNQYIVKRFYFSIYIYIYIYITYSNIQANLKDIAGLVPGHHNKANISIK